MVCSSIFSTVLKVFLFGASFELHQFDFALNISNDRHDVGVTMKQVYFSPRMLVLENNRLMLTILGDQSILTVKGTDHKYVSMRGNKDPHHSYRGDFEIPKEFIDEIR